MIKEALKAKYELLYILIAIATLNRSPVNGYLVIIFLTENYPVENEGNLQLFNSLNLAQKNNTYAAEAADL